MEDSGKPDERLAEKPEDLRAQIKLLTGKIESRDKLLAIVSHDIRSAVTPSAGLLALLLKSEAGNLTERQRNIIETLGRSAGHQLSLIENISELSRIQRGKVEAVPVRVKASAILESAAAEFEKMAREKNIELVVTPGPDAWIEVDRDKTLLALSKIVTNAIWFTQPGGRVELKVETEGPGVSLVVKDSGVGMDPADLNRLFDLSIRMFTLGTADEKGAGLGLCVAREFAALCGGKLDIESEKGAGATVRLTYPALKPETAD